MNDTVLEKKCVPCEGGVAALTAEEVSQQLTQLDSAWQAGAAAKQITREFSFKNYYHCMAFVNAVAWLAHAENHHPDMEVYYDRCVVHYTTHAISGLSENDFICAAKVDLLYAMRY